MIHQTASSKRSALAQNGSDALSVGRGDTPPQNDWRGRVPTLTSFLDSQLLKQNASQADYFVSVIASPDKLRQLATVASGFFSQFLVTQKPDHFLKLIDRAKWRPYVMLARRNRPNGELVGVFYMKERLLRGWPCGLLQMAHLTTNQALIARNATRESVLRAALTSSVNNWRIRAWRFLMTRPGSELAVVREIAAENNLDLYVHPTNVLAVLEVPPNFWTQLSSTMRRSLIRYRTPDQIYLKNMTEAEFRAAASYLEGKSKHVRDLANDEMVLSRIARQKRPLFVGLKTSQGRWISIAAGWYDDHSAYVDIQMNNEAEQEKGSSHMLMRGYIIDHLLENGIRQLVYPGGMGGHLNEHALRHAPVMLDQAEPVWKFFRTLIVGLEPHLPEKVAHWIHWNLPSLHTSLPTEASRMRCWRG